MTVRTLAAAAVACALAGPAAAVAFSQADLNRDGVVEYWEAKRAFPRLTEIHFSKCDPDHDGVIDRGEFPLLNDFYRLIYRMRG